MTVAANIDSKPHSGSATGKTVTLHARTFDGTQLKVTGSLLANGDILDGRGRVWRIRSSEEFA